MSSLGGYAEKIVLFDLTESSVKELPWNREEVLPFIGGRGLAASLLYRFLPPRVNPLGPENLLIFAAGPFAGTKVPFSSRWSVAAKSPLTGITGSGNGGGNFGVALKWAGLDALLLSGKAPSPSYLLVDNGKLVLKKADHLWGRSPEEVASILRSEMGVDQGDPHVGVVAVGRAGEAGVPLATIISDHHAAGRGGIGGVMGSKNLKAIVIRGSKEVKVFDPSALNKKARQVVDELVKQAFYTNFIKYGTLGGVKNRYGRLGGGLAFNGQRGVCPHLDEIDGDALYPHIWPSESCFGCPMPCTHYFAVEEGRYAPVRGKGCQNATVMGFGVQCGMSDSGAVLKAHAAANKYGLDLISMAGVIAFAMECYQRGIIGKETTEGLNLSWENANDAVLETIEQMGNNKGFGSLLNCGVKKLSDEWGEATKSFALHVKGLETTNVDGRVFPTWGLMYAVSSRGADHCRSLCFAEFGQPAEADVVKIAGTKEAADSDGIYGKGKLVAYFEDVRALADSLELCKFPTIGHLGYPENIIELFRNVVGVTWNAEELMKAGERIVQLERLFNLREGLTPEDDTLPERFLSEPVSDGPGKGRVVHLEPLLKEYYEVREWDLETGRPSPRRLEALGLQ